MILKKKKELKKYYILLGLLSVFALLAVSRLMGRAMDTDLSFKQDVKLDDM